MRQTLLTLILLATVSQAVAQESKAPDQKPTPAATTETEKPKNEVDTMLKKQPSGVNQSSVRASRKTA